MAPSLGPARSLPERRPTTWNQKRQRAPASSDSQQAWPQSNSRSCGKHSGKGGAWDDAGEWDWPEYLGLTDEEWKDREAQILDKQQHTVGWSGKSRMSINTMMG